MNSNLQPTSHTPEALRQMLARLRFDAPLEAQFRRDYEAGAYVSRAALGIIGILEVAVTPLYDASVLHAPEAFLRASHLLEFAVEIPVMFFSVLMCLYPPWRGASALATVISGLVVAACLMAQRIIGESEDFYVPHDYAAITLAAVLMLGRLRLLSVWPWMLAAMAACSYVTLTQFSGTVGINDTISMWTLFTVAAMGTYVLEYSARQSWYRGQQLEYQAACDGLTGLPNRRYFDLELRRLLREASRQRTNVALLILDVDHFKAYNDHFGHPGGDQCLRVIGHWLKSSMRRPQDFCARLGGEEFVAVWFGADATDATRLAEELRTGIETLAIVQAPGCGTPLVTASGGLVQMLTPKIDDDPDRLAEEMMKSADSALYAAKRAGRSRLALALTDPGIAGQAAMA